MYTVTFTEVQLQKERAVLLAIVTRLRTHKIITEKERMNITSQHMPTGMRSEIYKLLIKKDFPTASQILKIIKEIEDVGVELFEGELSHLLRPGFPGVSVSRTVSFRKPLASPGHQVETPMNIDVVLRAIFGYLGVEGIKNCRLVNKQWNEIAEPLLRKQAKVCFIKSGRNQTFGTPEAFYQRFGHSQLNVPFTSYSFSSSSDEHKWSVSEITSFFEERGQDVKELEFKGMFLKDDNGKTIHNYDISEWIQKSQIKKLAVNGFPFQNLTITISFSVLHDIEYFNLKNCQIRHVTFSEETKLSPIGMTMDLVSFLCDDKDLDISRINGYIDFKRVEKLSINFCNFAHSGDIIINLENCPKITELGLWGCHVESWAPATCKISKCNLINVVYTQKIPMQVEELTYVVTAWSRTVSQVNFVLLPAYIEKLNLYISNEIEVICPQRIEIPSLKFLKLSGNNPENITILSHFCHCENMVEFVIDKRLQMTAASPFLNWLRDL